jgi:hypothetical protein
MRLAFALLLILHSPAIAQDPPPHGIGFAQAEEGTWLCRHDQAEEALSCAREQCSEQAPGQECWATAWCFPANWSGLMTVWLEDFHTTHVLCGVPSESALRQALAGICAGDHSAISCDITLIINPEGVEVPVQDESIAGPAAPAIVPDPEEPESTGARDRLDPDAPSGG